MDSFVLLAYASLAASRTFLQQLLPILSELFFRFRRFIILVQMKKVVSMNYMTAAQAAESHGDK